MKFYLGILSFHWHSQRRFFALQFRRFGRKKATQENVEVLLLPDMSSREADPRLGYMTKRETEVKLPRPTRVKNKTPAPVQITAEQILREARERQEAEPAPPRQKITDANELAEYRLRKRKEYEDLIRRVRWNTSVWVKYAQWETAQKDFARARSVWERALEVDYR